MPVLRTRHPARPARPAARRRALLACGIAVACATGCASDGGPDPWEKMNRGTFAFNEAADEWVVGPVAQAWRFVLPDFVMTGVDNFFTNLAAPLQVGNNFLQGEIEEGYVQTWRFLLNSTVGVAGFVDVASMAGWPDYPEDFGLTLGTWGVPQGPYLVLPILGASTVRDTTGLAVDGVAAPYGYFLPIYVTIAARATDLLNTRAIYHDEITQSREEAFDFYLFVRSAYLQNRAALLEGSLAGRSRRGVIFKETEPEEDLYYFDDADELENEDGPGGAEERDDADQ